MTGATLKRDLRTGRPVWADSHGLGVPVRALDAAISVDVAIVGAGISGAFMAHELSRDHSVAVLDRRPPLTGSTMASTALLQWEIDLPLTVLAEQIGPDQARRAYLRSRAAVDDLKRIVAAEGIPCGLKAKDSLYLAGDDHGRRALEVEATARAALGLDSEFIGPAALRERFGIDRTGAIVSSGSVVFCCGYEFPKGVPTPGAKVISTWALASKSRTACPAWLRDTLGWEASDPYLYFRMSSDGRLIVGGEDEDAPGAHEDPARLKRKCATIRDKLKVLLPQLEFEVDYSWAGAFGESATGLPSIAPVPDMDHAWAVMGFGGNGITYSVIASQVVAAAIRGRPDPDADLYQS